MSILDVIKNFWMYSDKYKVHSEAVIISCYYNPTNNPYRLIAFNKFYETIKHLNHRIIECVIGDAEPQLPLNPNITRVSTTTTLWHKEALLNSLVKKLPSKFKYVFWVDADVTFTNKNWLVDAVNELQPTNNRMVQLFEYCIHLDKDQDDPYFDVTHEYEYASSPNRHPKLWRSFAANYVTTNYSDSPNYDKHGHVGFAWGARRSVLDAMPLYDKALIGGADHIIAHAAAGQLNHSCITKSFTEDIDAVNDWSDKFSKIIGGKLGYVKGDLYHIWHGDIEKRQYLKRIQDFTPIAKDITEKDGNGLYVTDNDEYVKKYFNHREDVESSSSEVKKTYPITKVVKTPVKITKNGVYGTTKKQTYSPVREQRRRELELQYPNENSDFIESLLIGYFTDSTILGTTMGGNLVGAAIGDMLNNDDNTPSQEGFNDGFGGGDYSGAGAGGDFGGAGATGDFSNDIPQNDNFS